MIFHRSLSDIKSLSETLLCILDDFNNAVIWMASARPPISNSSQLLTKILGIVLSALITIGITVTFIFHFFFFSSLVRSKYFSLFTFCFIFNLWPTETAKFKIRKVLLFSFFFLHFFFFFVFFVINHLPWSSNRDLVIVLYLKIPENFVRLTFQERY